MYSPGGSVRVRSGNSSPGSGIALRSVVVIGRSVGLFTDTCQRSGFEPTFVTWMNSSHPSDPAITGWPTTTWVRSARSIQRGT